MNQPPRIEAGTSRLYTVQYSANPVIVPTFRVDVGSPPAMVFSTAATSATTAYAFQTTYTTQSGADGVYRYRWTAGFSHAVGSVQDVTAGLIQAVTTQPWT